MVNQKIIINCKNINAVGFGKLLNVINESITKNEMDLYVKVEIKQ